MKDHHAYCCCDAMTLKSRSSQCAASRSSQFADINGRRKYFEKRTKITTKYPKKLFWNKRSCFNFETAAVCTPKLPPYETCINHSREHIHSTYSHQNENPITYSTRNRWTLKLTAVTNFSREIHEKALFLPIRSLKTTENYTKRITNEWRFESYY